MEDYFDDYNEYGQYEDDLENWETEQVFQDREGEYRDALQDIEDDLEDDE